MYSVITQCLKTFPVSAEASIRARNTGFSGFCFVMFPKEEVLCNGEGKENQCLFKRKFFKSPCGALVAADSQLWSLVPAAAATAPGRGQQPC